MSVSYLQSIELQKLCVCVCVCVLAYLCVCVSELYPKNSKHNVHPLMTVFLKRTTPNRSKVTHTWQDNLHVPLCVCVCVCVGVCVCVCGCVCVCVLFL